MTTADGSLLEFLFVINLRGDITSSVRRHRTSIVVDFSNGSSCVFNLNFTNAYAVSLQFSHASAEPKLFQS